MEPVNVIVVHDDTSENQALYVGGDLKAADSAIYGCDIAEFTKDMVVTVSFVTVKFPVDDRKFPEKFDECMLWKPVVDGQEGGEAT